MKRTYKPILWALTLLFILSSVMFAGITAAQETAVCPTGQGYWKNHIEVWPVTDLMLGSQMYTQLELIGILNLPPQGDASLILAHQLIAAKLNIASGADATSVSSLIAQADALFAALPNRLPFVVAPSSTEGTAMTSLSSVLDIYNVGGLNIGCNLTAEVTAEATTEVTPEATTEVTPEVTPPPTVTAVPPLPDDEDCVIDVISVSPAVNAKRSVTMLQEATPEATPEATVEPGINIDSGPGNDVIIVVEGPVEEINVNVITIYDIDIALNPIDPLLTVIQIGDVIRIEGDVDDDCDTLVIIAVIVIIVDVDIVIIGDGTVWRDNGDCSNGPPPWAPAHGWRRRCEGGGDGSGSGGMGMGSGS